MPLFAALLARVNALLAFIYRLSYMEAPLGFACVGELNFGIAPFVGRKNAP